MKRKTLQLVKAPMLEHALRQLSRAISRGLYPPGMRLVEAELCDTLDVSEASIGEALRQLLSESLIEGNQRRQFTVPVVSSKDAEDIYLMREWLETTAVRLLVEHTDDLPRKQLVRIHRDVCHALGTRDVRELSIMAGAFYQTIRIASNSNVIREMSDHLLVRVNYLRMRAMAEPQRLSDGMQEWDRLIKAIVARNTSAAAAAMNEHLANERRCVVSMLQREEQKEAGQMNLAGS